jgi:2,3-bisphosphoglycerate-dependent phosphoglycerate mutase
MTTIYFVRHCETDNANPDDRNRPLTEKGMADRALVTEYLSDKAIDAVLSSPYKRAVDTVADFAEQSGFEIETVEDFREYERSSIAPRMTDADFWAFKEKQWADFSYKLSDCESLEELQKRNIAALDDVLVRHEGKNIVIGTHGAALSAIINYYDNAYGFQDFMDMVFKTPWAVKMTFDGSVFAGMEKMDLLPLN